MEEKMIGRGGLLVLVVLAVALGLILKAKQPVGNGPLGVRAGTLVHAAGQRYQIHSTGGFHTHRWTWSGDGVVGQWDSGFKLYNFRYCNDGSISRVHRWYGQVTVCSGRWVEEILDADDVTPATPTTPTN